MPLERSFAVLSEERSPSEVRGGAGESGPERERDTREEGGRRAAVATSTSGSDPLAPPVAGRRGRMSE